MTVKARKRLALAVALAVGLAPLALAAAGDKAAKPKKAYFTGKVTPLAKLLAKFGSKLDPEAAPHWYALVAKDGKVYPLIKDDGSRMFFNDPKLLNRPMRLTGRLLPGSHLLQVLDVRSIIKGKLHEVYYWCDICSIRRTYKPKQCDCCGGPMTLREVPVKE
jgi:hypothetical protein